MALGPCSLLQARDPQVRLLVVPESSGVASLQGTSHLLTVLLTDTNVTAVEYQGLCCVLSVQCPWSNEEDR